MRVLGRGADEGDGQRLRLGRYRAADGSSGASVALDAERPHAALVVGKRGYGKSHTLGVLAEELARADGVAPIVVDPMGALDGLASPAESAVSARVVRTPTVRADALPPRSWCELLGLDPTTAAGTLVWRAASERHTLGRMIEYVRDSDVDPTTRRAARNHLELAADWGVFDPAGLEPSELDDGAATVLECSALPPTAANAVVRTIARGLYDAALAGRLDRLPWLLVDEAHAYMDGIAAPALRTLLTRGRSPGVSLVAATQRPGALPSVAFAQADLLVAHRLTARDDREALARACPSYLEGSLLGRLPTEIGAAAIVDDATEDAHAVRVRERETPHEGDSPTASSVSGR